MPINYRDFDLLIERAGEAYKARVVDSPAGEAITKLKLPFSESDVEQFFVQIGHSRLIESPQTQKMREFGQLLFEATFSGDVRDRLRESLNEVTRQGEGLRIRLRTGDIPELTNLPWEFMYDASLGRYLALSIETPLVRYLDIPRDIQPLTIRPPLRILAMISSPRDFPTLNVQKEWENLQESLSRLERRGMVALTRLEKPTLQMLQRQLRREHYHIFHFIGHGVFSKQYQDGFLLFEDELREGHRVSSRDLGILLHDHPYLRLAVLNACEGARISLEDQFSGTAQNLMQQGLPAVIAMQFRITDIAAITLAREFYAALADGYPVDAALTEARKAIKTHGNDLEWGTPVLYMRAPNGQIFDVESIPRTSAKINQIPEPTPEQIRLAEKTYTEALEAYYLEKWEVAFQKLQAVVDSNPDHKDAAEKLEIAKRKVQLLSLHEKAAEAETTKDWDQAVEFLEALEKEDPTFENVRARLVKARRENQLNDLYEEAQRLTKAEKWEAVLSVFSKIHSIDPKYPDAQGLRLQAEQRLAKTQKTQALENTYNQALKAFDEADWRQALKALQRVQKVQAGYRETEQLIQRAESELKHVRKEISRPKSAAATSQINYEWLVLAMFAGFGLARAIPELLLGGPTWAWIADNTNTYVAMASYMPVFGALLGITLWWMLQKENIKPTRYQFFSIILVSSISITVLHLITFYLVDNLGMDEWVWTVMFSTIGLAIGLLLTVILRQTMQSLNSKKSLFIIFGWTFAFLIGNLTKEMLFSDLEQFIDDYRNINLIVLPVESGIAGLIGSLITTDQLRTSLNIRINWKTVLAGTLGLGLSNLFTNIIFSSYDDELLITLVQLAMWGFLGGAALAVPSKNYKRYLLLGLLAGIGMAFGELAWRIIGEPYGFRFALIGAMFGLSLWIGIKRFSAAVVFLLIGTSAFIFRGSIVDMYYASDLSMSPPVEFTIFASSAGLMGLIIGMAWSFLNSEKNINSTQQIEK